MGRSALKSWKTVLSVILVTVLLASAAIVVSAEAATKRSVVKPGTSAPVFEIIQPISSDVPQSKASGSDVSINGGNTILPVPNSPTLSITAPSNAVTWQSITWTMDAYADPGAKIKSISFYVDNSLKATYTGDFIGVFDSCYGIGLDHATCFSTAPSGLSAGTHTYYATTVDNTGKSARDPISGTKSILVQDSKAVEVRLMGNGQGTILFNETGADCGSSGNYICKRFPIGKPVTISAYPAVGSEFSMWKGWECTGKTTTSCSITPSFIQGNDYNIVFSKTGTGLYPLMVWVGTAPGTITSSPAGLNCNTTCVAYFTANQQVTLTATPAAGNRFTKWYSDCAGATGNTCSINVNGAKIAGADFETIGPALSANHNPANPQINQQIEVYAVAGSATAPKVSIMELYVDNVLKKTCNFSGAPAVEVCRESTITYPTSGTHTYYARALDTNSWSRDPYSGTKSFTVTDSINPIVTVNAVPNPVEVGQTITITADATDESQLSEIKIIVDGSVAQTCPVSGTSGSCVYTTSYPATGAHTYHAEVTDASGNAGRDPASGEKTFNVIDSTNPAVTVSAPATVETGQQITVTATATDNLQVSTIEIFVDGASQAGLTCSGIGTPTASCSWGNTYASVGTHTYYAVATDSSSNTARDPVSGTKSFDVVAATTPTITVTATPNPTDINVPIRITATATDNVQVDAIDIVVDGTSQAGTTCSGLGTASASCYIDLTYPVAGTHNYHATATDNIGNIGRDPATGEKSFNVITNTLPVITLLSPANNTVWNSTFIDHSFRVADPENATVNCNAYYNGTLKMALPNTNVGSTIGFTITQSTNGIFDWYITCNDGVGVSTSATWRIIINGVGTPNTAPSVTVTSPADNSVQSSTTLNVGFTISDSEQVAGEVELYVDGTKRNAETELFNSAGTISASGLGLGVHTFYVKISDGALSATSPTFTFTVVTPPEPNTPPAIYILNTVNNTITNSMSWGATFYYTDAENLTSNCDLYHNGLWVIGASNVLNNTIDSWPFTLFEGNNNFYVSCYDASSVPAVNSSEIYNVIRDTIPPVITYDTFMPINQTITGAPAIYAYVNISETVVAAVLEINGANVTMSNAVGNWWRFWALGLPNGNYTYKVYATDAAGNTGTSYEAWTYINAANDNTAPGNITNLNETAVGQTWINWAWTNPGDADLNHIYILANGNFLLNLSSWNASQVNVTGLSPDTVYTISVQPVDVFGNAGNFTNDSARTLAAPQPPQENPSPGGGGGGGSTRPPTITGYVLEVPPNVTTPTPAQNLPSLELAGDTEIEVTAGITLVHKLDLRNVGKINDYYKIEILEGPEWVTLGKDEFSLAKGELAQFEITILAPIGTAEESFPLRIRASSVNNPEYFTTYDLTINVKSPTTAGAFVTGFISFAQGSGLAALVGALIIGGLAYLYWRGLPDARKGAVRGQFRSGWGTVRSWFKPNGKNGSEAGLVKAVTEELKKPQASSLKPQALTNLTKIDWAPRGTEDILLNLDNIRGQFMGNVSDAKDIKSRISRKPSDTTSSVAEKIAQIKDPGLLKSLKNELEKHD